MFAAYPVDPDVAGTQGQMRRVTEVAVTRPVRELISPATSSRHLVLAGSASGLRRPALPAGLTLAWPILVYTGPMLKLVLVSAVGVGMLFAQGSPQAGPGGPSGGGGGRGRGTPPKNLQVLKPEEVGTYMFMAVNGLGTMSSGGCLYCHVSNEARELDDKPQKVVARKMFQMVKDINANTFNGEQKVTCWTCHHGESKPAAPPPAPARGGFGGAGGPGAGGAPPPRPPQ